VPPIVAVSDKAAGNVMNNKPKETELTSKAQGTD
jgi:hypothetical protein